jgi:hypothetical protein
LVLGPFLRRLNCAKRQRNVVALDSSTSLTAGRDSRWRGKPRQGLLPWEGFMNAKFFHRIPLNRSGLIASVLVSLALLIPPSSNVSRAQLTVRTDPLASWNDGAAKQAIVKFVQTTTDRSSAQVRTARGAHRHVRPGRYALGVSSDVFAGCLLHGPCANRREVTSGAGER